MEQSLIDEYNNKSKDRISCDNSVSEYKETLEDCRMELINLKIESSNAFSILCHPIRTIRVNYYLRKLSEIENRFYSLLDADLLNFIDNTAPITEEALTEAYRFYKPIQIRTFINKSSSTLKKMLIRQKIY